MPTIIDRYMLRQYLQVLVICFLSLIGLYIVVDAFGHLDHFVDYADKNGNLLWILASYYGYRAIEFFSKLSGVLALISLLFTVTWIQRHNEMTALMAAGVSRMRVLRPALLAAVAVSLLAAANRELVIPNIRRQLSLDSKNLGGERETLMQPHDDRETGIRLNGRTIVFADKKIVEPTFRFPRHWEAYARQVNAYEAYYKPAEGDRPAGYLLNGVYSPKSLLAQPSLKIDDRPVVITPADAPWLANNQIFVVSQVDFEFLAAGSTWRDFASTAELIRNVKSPSTNLGADARVAIHGRFVQPLLDTTLIFLGLPLMVSRTNRNPFIAIGLCLVVATLFMSVTLGCQSLGSSGWLRPSLAVWMPLLVFVPIAVAMSDELRK
jgi:lipopolysaccharide export system permease protein